MAIASGLAAQIGVAAESTYGTYVAPTRFLEYNKADLKAKKNVVQGGGLAAGQVAQLGSRRVVTSVSVEGGFELEVANKGMGLLLAHLLGPQLLRSSRARRLPTSRLTQWATTSASR